MNYLCPRCTRVWTQDEHPDRSFPAQVADVRLCPNKEDCAAYARPRPRKRRGARR